MAGLDVGDVVRAPRRHGGKRTRRGQRGGSLLGGGCGHICRDGLFPALLGLTVQIISGDDGGRGFGLASAEQRIGGDAFNHAGHCPFTGCGRVSATLCFQHMIPNGKRDKFKCSPAQLFSKMGLRKTK